MVLKRAAAYDTEGLDTIFALVEKAQKTNGLLLAAPRRGISKRQALSMVEDLGAAIDRFLEVVGDPRHVAHLQAHFQNEEMMVD